MDFLIAHTHLICPVAMILLSVGAAIVYFCVGDVRRGIYWTASAIIISSVTF